MNFLSRLVSLTSEWFAELWRGWDRFWFTPAAPQTLGLLRILSGSMLLYTHLIWSLNLMAFLGPQSWVSKEVIHQIYRDSYAQSYLFYIESPTALWILHGAALIVFAAFTVGFYTRVTSILAVIITLSYCHRLAGALFGLDQINAMLAMYLAIGPAGAAYSLDAWLAARKSGRRDPEPRVSTNIAVRLIQLHMCIIYLFGGIGKMRGELWWDGSAVWFAIANYEYQSFDMTWLVRYPFVIALLTHATVFWETFYPFLVWPRLTRPIALGMAVLVHAGIALFLGMPTFGLVMIFGNIAFIAPETVSGLVECVRGRMVPAATKVSSRKTTAALC